MQFDRFKLIESNRKKNRSKKHTREFRFCAALNYRSICNEIQLELHLLVKQSV